MSNVIWLGALLLFGSSLQASSENPNVLQALQPGSSSSNVLSLTLNTKKYTHTIGDRFLSFTVEPSTIFSALLQNNLGTTAINMAKVLNPAYIRISGPECNYFTFRGAQDTAQSSPLHPVKYGRNNITITGWHWSQLNEFVAKSGLDLIVGLNVMNRQHGKWDLGNTLDLVSYSDKHGYNMAFQLGNDIQTVRSRIDSSTLGKEVTRLRKVLEALPRYTHSAIISPDIKSCDTQDEVRYLKNFIIESGPSLTAVTYQVPFASEKNVENPTEIFTYIQNQLENRVWPNNLINKYLGKTVLKKPLWIVESGNKDTIGDFTDGITWAQRLCAGARVGINTIMRKPSLLALSKPTPEYWVSILHKALIGSEVLDIKISSGNKTRLETVAHCTKMSPHDPNEGILAPEYRYTRGAVTVFGVNVGSENVRILLKTGQKQSTPLHQYFLTANTRQIGKRATKSLSVMLNGQKLVLSSDGELPILSPKIRGSHQLITIPSQCVFFFVLPDSKSKACTAVQIEESKELYKNGMRISDQEEFDEIDYDTSVLDQEDELGSNEKNAYVAFRSKYIKDNGEPVVQIRNENNEGSKNEMATNHEEIARTNNDDLYDDNDNPQQSEPIVKYVTFSNNNWLSKFPKSLNQRQYAVESSTYSPVEDTTIEVQTQKSVPQSRREKYHVLAQAVAGKRYPEKNIRSDVYSNLDSVMASIKPAQALKLIKRSTNHNYSPSEIQDMLEQFTNKEKQPINPQLKTNETSSDWKPNDNNVENPEWRKKKATQIQNFTNPQTHSIAPRVQDLSVTSLQTTQQAVVTPTPEMSTTTVIKQPHIVEYHIQKIKTRKEQALGKINKTCFHIIGGRRSQKKLKIGTINLIVPTTEKSVMTSTEESFTTKSKQIENENIGDFNEKFRLTRQINCITTTENYNIKPSPRPHLYLKPKKSIQLLGVENVISFNTPEFKTTHAEPNVVTENYNSKSSPQPRLHFKLNTLDKSVIDKNVNLASVSESEMTHFEPSTTTEDADFKPSPRPRLHLKRKTSNKSIIDENANLANTSELEDTHFESSTSTEDADFKPSPRPRLHLKRKTSDKSIIDENANLANTSELEGTHFESSTSTKDADIKLSLRPHLHLKPKASDKSVIEENINLASTSEFETIYVEPSTTTKIDTTKPNNYNKNKSRILGLPKLNPIMTGIQWKEPMLRDSRETAQLSVSKLKIKPNLHSLGKVITDPNVNAHQIKTNEKIVEKLVENIENGRETLQSKQVVSPIDKNGESTLENKKSLTVAEKIRALEERSKNRRLEMKRKLELKFHKAKKRSLMNELIEDDMTDVNDILDPARFESNELDVDVGPVLKRDTIVRYPRAVADFTVKLNEVNTYVDRNKKPIKLKTNEIVDDNGISPQKSPNDIRPSAEDNAADDVINIKYKRKSLFEEDEDDYFSKTSSNMMNKLFGHMQKLWKYIKKTLAF